MVLARPPVSKEEASEDDEPVVVPELKWFRLMVTGVGIPANPTPPPTVEKALLEAGVGAPEDGAAPADIVGMPRGGLPRVLGWPALPRPAADGAAGVEAALPPNNEEPSPPTPSPSLEPFTPPLFPTPKAYVPPIPRYSPGAAAADTVCMQEHAD
eukprot:scaffold4409_cov369-Prasinococcus_capsulatus_cf.AAC.17